MTTPFKMNTRSLTAPLKFIPVTLCPAQRTAKPCSTVASYEERRLKHRNAKQNYASHLSATHRRGKGLRFCGIPLPKIALFSFVGFFQKQQRLRRGKVTLFGRPSIWRHIINPAGILLLRQSSRSGPLPPDERTPSFPF